jgi:hypothetical protein
MNVSDLKPATNALVLSAPRVKALARRLTKKLRPTTADTRALCGAVAAINGDGVVLEVFGRYISQPSGDRVEMRRYLGLRFETHDGKPATVALRAVKSKPGYTQGTKPVEPPSNKQKEECDATVQP